MKKYGIGWLFLLIWGISKAQTPEEILARGLQLYRLEKAAWHATDHFLTLYPEKQEALGGYLSYINASEQVVTLFYNQDETPLVLGRYLFDSIPQPGPLSVDTNQTGCTDAELKLIQVRTKAREAIVENSGDFFSFYQNTNLNLIVLPDAGNYLIYVLTGPENEGVTLIGNDYKLTYSDKKGIYKKEKLHTSLVSINNYPADTSEAFTVSLHSHVLSQYITETDICTLLLYREYAQWKTHYVVGKKWVSVFDLTQATLAVISRKAFDRIAASE